MVNLHEPHELLTTMLPGAGRASTAVTLGGARQAWEQAPEARFYSTITVVIFFPKLLNPAFLSSINVSDK